MKESKFIEQKKNNWELLEKYLNILSKKNIKSLSYEDINNFISLYNSVSKDLSYSRTNYPNSNTTKYLNNIASKSYEYLYTTPQQSISKISKIITKFPDTLRSSFTPLVIAATIFLLGMLFSFIFTVITPENSNTFLPPQLATNIDSINIDFEKTSNASSSISSTFILTNNISVGIFAFALGFTFAIGTIYILLTNSFLLGSLAALFYLKKANLLFWSLILPHGIIELFAIFICGAAGITIGYSLLDTKEYSRVDSLIIGTKKAVKLLLSTIPMFFIAGLIEGFITPYIIPGHGILTAYLKLGFSLITLFGILGLLIYSFRNSKKEV
jgi:uncharacterized membrane protein SpoIIM required for sporulation